MAAFLEKDGASRLFIEIQRNFYPCNLCKQFLFFSHSENIFNLAEWTTGMFSFQVGFEMVYQDLSFGPKGCLLGEILFYFAWKE